MHSAFASDGPGQRADVVALLDELRDEVRAEEPGGACDEYDRSAHGLRLTAEQAEEVRERAESGEHEREKGAGRENGRG